MMPSKESGESFRRRTPDKYASYPLNHPNQFRQSDGEEDDHLDSEHTGVKDTSSLLPQFQPDGRASGSPPEAGPRRRKFCTFSPSGIVGFGLSFMFVILTLYWAFGSRHTYAEKSCDSINAGFKCRPEISRHWGQYSPYFQIESEIPDKLPDNCKVTFAQVLSRHGARHPTPRRSRTMAAVVDKIQSGVDRAEFKGKYAFLAEYEYQLRADDLTHFGQQQMVNSGIKFYSRYKSLARERNPFVRSAGQERVVVSAQNFTKGFHSAKANDRHAHGANPFPYSDMVIIEENDWSNSSLSGARCDAFRQPPVSLVGPTAKHEWAATFVPPIQERLNHDLPGAKLSIEDVLSVMELCPFETVFSKSGSISKFCDIFSAKEFQQYDYYHSVSKYYGYGNGNPLGPSQGIGFTNELIARMTGRPVRDATSTNRTLDSDPKTFPLGPEYTLYADFSHDNDMMTIFSAMGLFNATQPLSNTTLTPPKAAAGFSAAWTIPFAARAYFEKLDCEDAEEEYVRILVNDRVMPLETCAGADKYGRCKLSAWVESLSFARHNGRWRSCSPD